MSTRISASLTRRLRSSANGEPLDVVVELAPADLESEKATAAHDKVAWMKASFAERAEPVCRVIESLGGTVKAGLWLDETLRVRMPSGSIQQLARTEGVRALDLPRALLPDSFESVDEDGA